VSQLVKLPANGSAKMKKETILSKVKQKLNFIMVKQPFKKYILVTSVANIPMEN